MSCGEDLEELVARLRALGVTRYVTPELTLELGPVPLNPADDDRAGAAPADWKRKLFAATNWRPSDP